MNTDTSFQAALLSLQMLQQRGNAYLARQEIERLLAPLQQNPKRLEPFGFKVYSQGDEDGIIEEIFARLGIEKGFFCEIGVENGLECNSLYLLHKGWQGIWIEGNKQQVAPIRQTFASLLQSKRLTLAISMVTAENINHIHQQLRLGHAYGQEVDFYSIDIDGNDIHCLAAMELRPKVLCVEYNAKFPPTLASKPCYDPAHCWKGTDYMGSSLLALCEVAQGMGYALVGTNITGANAFFVRQDLLGQSFATDISVKELYNAVRYWLIFDHFGHIGHRADFGRYEALEDPQANLAYWLARTPECPPPSTPAVLACLPGLMSFPFCIQECTDIYVSEALKKYGIWEPFETQLLLKIIEALPEASFVLNIGANIGWYAVVTGLLLKQRPIAKVVAIEPAPHNFALLQKNIACNGLQGCVHPLQAAASDHCGRASLHLCPDNQGDHRLIYDNADWASVEVDVTTIDTLAEGWDALPDIVIMDTQGHDALILQGAKQSFATGWQPVVMFEFWPYEILKSGTDPLVLLQHYWERGYELFVIHSAKQELQKLDAGIEGLLRNVRNLYAEDCQKPEQTASQPQQDLHEYYLDILAIPPAHHSNVQWRHLFLRREP